MRIGLISCSRMYPRLIPSSRPRVEVGPPNGSSRLSMLLSRSTIRAPLPSSSAPAGAVKSATSVSGFRWTEHTFRTNFRCQVCAEAEWPYGDMSRDPQGRQLLGRFARFLGLSEKWHSGGDGGRRTAWGAKLPPGFAAGCHGCRWSAVSQDSTKPRYDSSLRAMRTTMPFVVGRSR